MIETERVVSKDARLQPFILTGYQGAPTRGAVTIQAFDREQRWRRALAGLGKWWGIALLSVFIPVAHFLLVPSFFVYGLGQFFQRLGTAEVAAAPRGTCPDCRAAEVRVLAPRWRARARVRPGHVGR